MSKRKLMWLRALWVFDFVVMLILAAVTSSIVAFALLGIGTAILAFLILGTHDE